MTMKWLGVVLGLAMACVSVAVPGSACSEDSAPPPVPHTLPAVSGETKPAAETQVLLKFSLYRVKGDISGETSLTDNIWEGIEGGTVEAKKGPWTFFTLANLTIGRLFSKVKFVANEKGWTWDGRDKLPEDRKDGAVEMLTAPMVIVIPGQRFQIWVGAEVPVQYFQKQADGRFELKTFLEPTGLGTSATVELAGAGRVVLRDLVVQTRTIEERERIANVTLDVGRPFIKTREAITTICIQTGRDYGMILNLEGYGSMIIRLRVEVVKPS